MAIGVVNNPYRGVGYPLVADNKTAISGAHADTAVKTSAGVLCSVLVTKAGASGSTITLYDGSVATGTVIGVIDGTQLAPWPFCANIVTSLHVATVDSGGTLRLTVTWM
jgi:hypothetical protein